MGKTFVRRRIETAAVRDVSFSVGRGEFVAIVGPSGCGKSTLLGIAAGLVPPTTGSIRYLGQKLNGANTRVGFVTQQDHLLPWRTVWDNIVLALEIRHLPPARRNELVGQMVHRVGLEGFEKHYPKQLSGGMRKRVALARTLVYEPETLLLDEPFGALDAQLRTLLQQDLLEIWSGSSMSVIFVTHDLGEAVALADRVLVMSARPSRILLDLSIDLPRPRDVFGVKFHPRYGELSEQLWRTLRGELA